MIIIVSITNNIHHYPKFRRDYCNWHQWDPWEY